MIYWSIYGTHNDSWRFIIIIIIRHSRHDKNTQKNFICRQNIIYELYTISIGMTMRAERALFGADRAV